MVYNQRIVVAGAGIIGLSAAYSLLRQGWENVTVLEQATVNHEKGASHGISRLLRYEYGDDAFHSQMVRLSLRRWKNLERCTGKTLYTPTGIIVLGNEHDNFTKPSYNTLREQGHAPERLTRRTCMQRFPQFNTQDYDTFLYNTEAGMLHASTCLQTLRASIIDLGGVILENHGVTAIHNDNSLRPICITLTTGQEITADRVVIAAGPWVHHLLGEYRLPVRLTRQYLLYFANLPSALFGLHAFPAFMADDLYGFPMHNTCNGSGPCWLKAASHTYGAPAKPEDVEPIDERVITSVKQQLCDLLPALQDATLARVESYIYDVSLDENFILDRLPDDPRLIVATGMTGHAFKFAPLLGDLLASLVNETEPVVPIERFQLDRFAHIWREQVHSVA